MSDNESPLRSAIKSGVAATNSALASLQSTTRDYIQKPINSVKESTSSIVNSESIDSVKSIYTRRHEYAPHIIGGTAVTIGGISALRRGRIAGVLGGLLGAGAAYGIVYDQIDMEHLPNIVFGKKE